jgi:amino acid transporter
MLSILQGSQVSHLSSKKYINEDAHSMKLENWEYPGWGSVYENKFDNYSLPLKEKKHQLDVYRSTAIAGNDLLASVLYTTGICCIACGQLAPIAMLLCCLALYPFRKIFQECGTALPLNGGVYVAMLNSTSKLTATFAASCSLISYSATAVVSAASCTSYAAGQFGNFEVLPVTIGIIGAFGVLVFFGVKDSANIATLIFAFHLFTLIVLLIASFVFIFRDSGKVLIQNWQVPLPSSQGGSRPNSGAFDLYLGYSVALLGLTGFETSANYIEGILQ